MALCLFAVLRRVRQLEKKLMSTDGRLSPVREVLSRFTAKLSDAEGLLHKAATTVQQTEDMNRANVFKYQRNEVISFNPPTLQSCAILLSLGSSLSLLSPPHSVRFH